jgi:hypothetical protein
MKVMQITTEETRGEWGKDTNFSKLEEVLDSNTNKPSDNELQAIFVSMSNESTITTTRSSFINGDSTDGISFK